MGVPAELEIDGVPLACEAQNISRGGALLVGAFPTPSTNGVRVALKTPAGNLEIRLSGRVVRIEPGDGPDERELAIEFTEMDETRRLALETLLARLLESPAATPLDHLKPTSPPQEVRKALEAIPLQQRISWSSRAGLKDRELLRLDTNAAVLEALARNSSLGVIEARALAGSAYLMPGTLETLAADHRFKGDEELRMAIAVHPRVTPSTAEKITADLKIPQIKKLLSRPGLSPWLREKLFRRTTRS
jgi:hypothetical protein